MIGARERCLELNERLIAILAADSPAIYAAWRWMAAVGLRRSVRLETGSEHDQNTAKTGLFTAQGPFTIGGPTEELIHVHSVRSSWLSDACERTRGLATYERLAAWVSRRGSTSPF